MPIDQPMPTDGLEPREPVTRTLAASLAEAAGAIAAMAQAAGGNGAQDVQDGPTALNPYPGSPETAEGRTAGQTAPLDNYPADDVSTVVKALVANRYDRELDANDLDEVARIALTALAGRGRLLPVSGDTTERWGVSVPQPGGRDVIGCDSRAHARVVAAELGGCPVVRRTLRTWVDADGGSWTLASPWAVVPKEGESDA